MNVLSDEQIAEIRKKHAEAIEFGKGKTSVQAARMWAEIIGIDAHKDRAALLAHIDATSAQGSAGGAAPTQIKRIVGSILKDALWGRERYVYTDEHGTYTRWGLVEKDLIEQLSAALAAPSTPTPSPTQENEN